MDTWCHSRTALWFAVLLVNCFGASIVCPADEPMEPPDTFNVVKSISPFWAEVFHEGFIYRTYAVGGKEVVDFEISPEAGVAPREALAFTGNAARQWHTLQECVNSATD
jgi:hypothetical protein